jgi:hypothetical protein
MLKVYLLTYVVKIVKAKGDGNTAKTCLEKKNNEIVDVIISIKLFHTCIEKLNSSYKFVLYKTYNQCCEAGASRSRIILVEPESEP